MPDTMVRISSPNLTVSFKSLDDLGTAYMDGKILDFSTTDMRELESELKSIREMRVKKIVEISCFFIGIWSYEALFFPHWVEKEYKNKYCTLGL